MECGVAELGAVTVLIKQPLDSQLSLLVINSTTGTFNTKERNPSVHSFAKILQSLIEILYLILKTIFPKRV